MRKYFSNAVATLSLITAFLCFILCILFLDFKTAVFFSLLFALGLMLVLPFVLYFTNKKYKSIDITIKEKILFKEKINFAVNDKLRNGYFVVSKTKIHIFSRDKKPYIEEHIDVNNIIRANALNEYTLNIYVTSSDFFNIKTKNCNKLLNILKDMGIMTYTNY